VNRDPIAVDQVLPWITHRVAAEMEQKIVRLGDELAGLLDQRWDGAPGWEVRLEVKMEELKDAIDRRSAWIDEVNEHLDRCDVVTADLLS
jgi:hypothetical protein